MARTCGWCGHQVGELTPHVIAEHSDDLWASVRGGMTLNDLALIFDCSVKVIQVAWKASIEVTVDEVRKTAGGGNQGVGWQPEYMGAARAFWFSGQLGVICHPEDLCPLNCPYLMDCNPGNGCPLADAEKQEGMG